MPGDAMDEPVSGAQLKAAVQDQIEKDKADLHALNPKEAAELNLEHLHDELEDFPSEEDIKTLRRVSDHIPLKIFTIAFVELCERFSFYGSTVVCK
jgi:proton-dependent oligopeptide transporter, POT family